MADLINHPDPVATAGGISGFAVTIISTGWAFLGDNHQSIAAACCLFGVAIQFWAVKRQTKKQKQRP